ncbi:MAG TPA: response regulator [Vicinamibacterales bacterium]|nr:response regulator [Vicinamibacterales bacterium]
MPHTLLLADDSIAIQRVIELTFADEDVDVVAVADGDQAIARMEASPPDIVLADIGMPGKNGYEVAQYVKQSPRLAHIPVVLLTGAFEPVDQARATAAGCEGVLAKPFEPHLVIGRVKELLAKGPRPAAVGEPANAPAPVSSVDSWLTSAALPPIAPPVAAESTKMSNELNRYFDQLDVALTNLESPAQGFASWPPSPHAPAEPASVRDDADWLGTINPIGTAVPPARWDIVPPPALSHSDMPLSYGSPVAARERSDEIAATEPQADVALDGDAASSAHAVSVPPPTEPEGVAAADAVLSTAPPASIERASERPSASAPEPEPATVDHVPARAAGALPSLADAFAALLAAEQQAAAPGTAPLWPAAAPAPALSEDALEEIAQRVLRQLSDRVVREIVADVVSATAERLVREEIERIKNAVR